MPPTSATTPTNAVVLERIENLRCDVTEIKEILKAHDQREQAFEREYYIQHQTVVSDVNSLKAKVSTLEDTVKELTKLVTEQAQTNRILKWMLGILTPVIVALAVAWMTGKLQVVFP